MSGGTQDSINTEKVTYLLGLLGRQRSVSELNPDLSDSDFEDIASEEDELHKDSDKKVYTMLSQMLTKPPVVEDSYESSTTDSQSAVEDVITGIYTDLIEMSELNLVRNDPFNLKVHVKYAEKCLTLPFPPQYVGYDANHGWMLYWLVNFLRTMNRPVDESVSKLVTDKILRVTINEGLGGIGGGLGQIGHAASMYASVLALVLVEDFDTLNRIRHNLYKWMMSLKKDNGSFSMHPGGESDTRSTYCILVIASLLNILDEQLCKDTASWLATCQTYEGGFSGIPNTEAHGGYTFCAIASYFVLLGKGEGLFKERLNNVIDVDNLLRWTAMRQYHLEGGFSGRTNKLVDACYSFWIGGIFPLLEMSQNTNGSLFDRDALRTYILNCCQDSRGGLRDKPGKLPDFYHSNYTTLGLSIAEHEYLFMAQTKPANNDDYAYLVDSVRVRDGDCSAINPIFGLPLGVAEKCKEYFKLADK